MAAYGTVRQVPTTIDGIAVRELVLPQLARGTAAVPAEWTPGGFFGYVLTPKGWFGFGQIAGGPLTTK